MLTAPTQRLDRVSMIQTSTRPDATRRHDRALLEKIDRYLNTVPRAASDVVDVAPFLLFFRRDTDCPYITYARPAAPLAGDLSPAIREVRAAFAGRGRVCRWEWVADLFPELAPALVAAGFPGPERRPLMVVTRASFRPLAPPGVAMRVAGPEDDLAAIERVQQRGFGMEDAAPGPEPGAELRGALGRGSRVIAAWIGGTPVAAGVHNPVADTTELAGIATLPEFRRRGIGAALTAALAADAFARGCECVFLSAGDETIARVYGRVGFLSVGMAMDVMDVSNPLAGGDDSAGEHSAPPLQRIMAPAQDLFPRHPPRGGRLGVPPLPLTTGKAMEERCS